MSQAAHSAELTYLNYVIHLSPSLPSTFLLIIPYNLFIRLFLDLPRVKKRRLVYGVLVGKCKRKGPLRRHRL